MKRTRLLLLAASSLSAIVIGVVACGGGDDNAGGDDTNDSGGGPDTTTGDSGPPADTGTQEAGPFCNTTPCVISVGVGSAHSCAVISDGTVRCWGGNQFGELGSGTVIDGGSVVPSLSAAPLSVPGMANVVSVAGGGVFEGDIDYSCALHANKTIDCWGFNEFGNLARGDASPIADPNPASILLTNAIDVSLSFLAACAVLSSGDVTCWGSNGGGQIDPPLTNQTIPTTTVVNLGGKKFTQVSVGYINACAVTDDNHVWCWGAPTAGDNGHLTDGGAQDSIGAEVPGLDSVAAVAAGYQSACALKTDGSIVCWGDNEIGMLGRNENDGGPPFDPTSAPIDLFPSAKFTQVVAHVAGYCGLVSDGTVMCWGFNAFGSAGVGVVDGGEGQPAEIPAPTTIPGLTDVIQLSSIGAGGHTCALIKGGAVKCWGLNSTEQLGLPLVDGGDSISITPVTVTF